MKSANSSPNVQSSSVLSLSNDPQHNASLLDTLQPSAQVLQLIASSEEYAARYTRCRFDVGFFKTVTELVEKGQSGKGYRQEYTSFRGMPRRALKLYKLSMDAELRDFRLFLLHVGPKPHYNSSNPLSVDRINNSKGYLVGNINWADKAQQAANRRSSRHHEVEGARLSDAELATLFSKRTGQFVSAPCVKKRRQRGMTTEQQFALAGLPYASGFSPKMKWNFPPEAAPLQVLYETTRRRRETRIEFYVRTLEERVLSLRDKLASPKYANLDQRRRAEVQIGRYELERRRAVKTLASFDDLEFEDDLLPLLLPEKLPKPVLSLTTEAANVEDSPAEMDEQDPGCGFSKATWEELQTEFEEAQKRVKGIPYDSKKVPQLDLIMAVAELGPEHQLAIIELANRYLSKLEYLTKGDKFFDKYK